MISVRNKTSLSTKCMPPPLNVCLFKTILKEYVKMTMRGCRGRGDRGSRPLHSKDHNIIGFLSNIGPDPLKYQQANKPVSMLGHFTGKMC